MVAISEAMVTALQAYRAGNLVQAEWMCRQVLEQQPHSIVALHLLGAIAAQTGRLESAIGHYQTVITLDPNHAEAHGNLAVALHERGDWNEAANHFQRSLTLNPYHAPTHFNAGNLALKQGHVEQAIAHYQQAIALKPNYAKAYTNLGNALRAQGMLDAAIAQYRQVIALTPNDAQAYNNLGSALQAQGQFETAIGYYQRSIALHPTNAETHFNLGNAFRALCQLDAAVQQYRQALTLNADRAEFYNNLALALHEQEQLDAAIVQLQRAIALKPEYAEAHSNLGIVLQETNQLQAAIEHYQQAVLLAPQFAQAHTNLGMVLVASGEFARGFAEYEWRWYCENGQPRSFPQPLWDGSDLAGKTILLYTEQGYGDSIQFIRYATFIAQRASRVVVECQEELLSLFSTVSGIDQLVSAKTSLPKFDTHTPLLSLPRLLGTTLDTIPNQIPYLKPPGRKLQPATVTSSVSVGLVWASGHQKSRDRIRHYKSKSCPLSAFAELFTLSGMRFYSLQVGSHAADIAKYGLQNRLHDLSPQLQDFADTAAAIDQLDLIITVDTAVAHLAGALAKPVWVLLPFAGDWRWMLHREDSPWYPTMRLFRQDTPSGWDRVITKVVQALRARIEHEHSP